MMLSTYLEYIKCSVESLMMYRPVGRRNKISVVCMWFVERIVLIVSGVLVSVALLLVVLWPLGNGIQRFMSLVYWISRTYLKR